MEHDGSFRWPYRFPANRAGSTFFLRARVSSASYPFSAGNSPAVAVHVRR